MSLMGVEKRQDYATEERSMSTTSEGRRGEMSRVRSKASRGMYGHFQNTMASIVKIKKEIATLNERYEDLRRNNQVLEKKLSDY